MNVVNILKEGNLEPHWVTFECYVCGCIYQKKYPECMDETGCVIDHTCPCCGATLTTLKQKSEFIPGRR